MAGIIWTPEERTTQPLDAQPLSDVGKSARMVSAVYPNKSGLFDAARRSFVVKSQNGGAAGGISTVATPIGLALQGSNAGGADVYALGGLGTVAPWSTLATNAGTVFVLLRRIGNNSGGAAQIIGVLHSSDSPYNILSLYDASGTGTMTLGASPGGSFTSLSGGAMTNNALEFWVGTYDGATLRLYKNGVQQSSTSASGALSTHANLIPVVLNYGDGGYSRTFNGQFFLGGMAPICWDAEFIAKVARNPWQLFEADNDPVFYSLGGGGAAALEGSLAASGTVSGALTTAIQAAASVIASASVTVALTTGIRPAASVSASATVSAALTTAIQMAGSLSATASVTGDISGAAALASTVSASAIVTGALSTAIRLNASVSGAATVTGVLAEPGAAAALEASIAASATVSASLTGGSSSIWTPASASSGTWTPASAAGGTWVAQ